MLVPTLAVIGKRFDNSAIACSDASRTGRSDALEFLPQRAQPRDLLTDIVEMRDRDRVGLIAGHAGVVGQPEQGPDPIDRKPQIASMLDER